MILLIPNMWRFQQILKVGNPMTVILPAMKTLKKIWGRSQSRQEYRNMEPEKDHGLLLYVMDHHPKTFWACSMSYFFAKVAKNLVGTLKKHEDEVHNGNTNSIQMEFDHVCLSVVQVMWRKMYLVQQFQFYGN